MVLTDLKALAGQLGIKGTSGMRKGDLVAAIAARQSGAGAVAPTSDAPRSSRRATARHRRAGAARDRRAGHRIDHRTNGHTGDPVLPLGDLAPGTTRRPGQPTGRPDRQPASSG